MSLNSKKVSVIIPCYNQAKYVSDAINSVLSQTYENIEIVCVNDGSSDNSSQIINSFKEKNKNILFFDNKVNHGVIYSRNFAIDNCSGEYVLPLDADDIIEPTYIEKAVKVLDENPNIGIVYCKARLFGNVNKNWKLKEFNKSDFLYENCIFCCALFRKSDFYKAGKYKEYMINGPEDYDLWLSLLEQGFDVYRIDEVLFNYRQYNNDSRSDLNSKHSNNAWLQLVKSHIDLYLSDKQFIERLIFSNPIVSKKKYKKYKKIFNILFVVVLLETLILFILMLLFIMNYFNV